MYSVTKRGTEFEGLVRYQDGTEKNMFPSVEEAEQYVISSAKGFNNVDITTDDIAYFEEIEVKATIDTPIKRDEFTGLFVVCWFSRAYGWTTDGKAVPYAEAAAQYKEKTRNESRYTKKHYEASDNVSGFYKIQKERDSRMFRSLP